LRYKQFVSQTVLVKAKEFLGTDKSYRATVRHQHRSLVYDDRQDRPLAERGAAMAHSSVWRCGRSGVVLRLRIGEGDWPNAEATAEVESGAIERISRGGCPEVQLVASCSAAEALKDVA